MATDHISESTWKLVRQLVDQGLKLTEIERRLKGTVRAAQISAKKRQWEKESYFQESKYAKYHTEAYKKWRKAVLARDGYKCQVCGRGRAYTLQADHIRSWALHPELRYDISNGRTLCKYHHKRTLNFGRKALTCDDEKNGTEWIIKEKLLWKKKQLERQAQSRLKAKLKTEGLKARLSLGTKLKRQVLKSKKR